MSEAAASNVLSQLRRDTIRSGPRGVELFRYDVQRADSGCDNSLRRGLSYSSRYSLSGYSHTIA